MRNTQETRSKGVFWLSQGQTRVKCTILDPVILVSGTDLCQQSRISLPLPSHCSPKCHPHDAFRGQWTHRNNVLGETESSSGRRKSSFTEIFYQIQARVQKVHPNRNPPFIFITFYLTYERINHLPFLDESSKAHPISLLP